MMRKKTAAVMTAIGLGVLALTASVVFQASAQSDADFRISGTTLTAYVGTDTFVSVPDTVTIIGESAFADNTTMTSIELPDELTEIGYKAFSGCTALTDITLPDSVTKVGPGAFTGCTALTLAEIGPNVSSWGSGVFSDCTSLSKLIVDENNPYLVYYAGALYNGDMSMLYQVLGGREGEYYVMPDEVETIDTYAFWNLQNVTNVKVSSNVTQIPAYSMSSMGSVQNVILPSSVTTIAKKAFANNDSLQQVMIPSSVSSIDDTAFASSSALSILTTKGTTAEAYGTSHDIPVIYEAILATDFNDSDTSEKPIPRTITVTQTNTTTTVVTGEEETTTAEEETENETETDEESETNPLDVEEEGVVGKTRIVAGNAVIFVGKDAQKVYGLEEGTTEEETETETQQEKTQEEETETETTPAVEEETTEAETETETAATEASTVTVQNTLTTKEYSEDEIIAQKAYYKQKNLTNYTISETIKEIGRLSFAQSGLWSIEIPDGVETIGYGAFMDCEDLETVTIADSVTSIGTKAFDGTPWLENWLAGESAGGEDDFLIVGDGIVLAYRGDAQQVEIPDGVKQIGADCFKGHEELTEVTLPDSLIKIGADAFRNCTNLTSVKGGSGSVTVVRGAFYGTEISEDDL